MGKKDFKVALCKELCPICGKEMDGPFVMNQVLTKEAANNVAALNGKVIGWADHCCKECAEYKDKAIFFIGIDEEKSEPNNPYRTGKMVGINKDSDFVTKNKELDKFIITLKDGAKMVYIDEKLGEKFGLWKLNNEEHEE